jgi:hypothetical protein
MALSCTDWWRSPPEGNQGFADALILHPHYVPDNHGPHAVQFMQDLLLDQGVIPFGLDTKAPAHIVRRIT